MCELERRSMTSDSLLSPLIGVVKPQGGVAPNVLVYERLGVSLRALHAPSELLLDAITLPSLLLAISAHIFALRPLKSLLSCDIPITVDTIFVIRSETGYFPKLLSPLVPSNPLPIVQRILIDALSTLLSPPHPNSDTAYLHVLARYLLAILEPECTSAEQLMGLLQTVADSHVPGLVANLPAFHTAASQAVVSALVVDTIASRAILRTDGAVLDFVNVVGSVVAALGRAQSLFKAEAMRLMRVRSQWMDKQAEEVDANEKSLVACARLCAWDDFGPEEVLRGVDDVFALLDGGMFVRRSLFLDLPPNGVSNVFEMLSESTRVQQGLAAPSVGPALHWYKSNEPTLIPIHLRDQLGEPIRGIDAADVTCSITPAVDVQCSIYFTSVSTLMIQLVVPPNVSDALTLHVDLFGHTLLEATVQVRCSGHLDVCGCISVSCKCIQACMFHDVCLVFCLQTATSLMGEELPDKSIVTAHTERNYGLAVSHDGSLLAVANYGSCSVSLYAFPTGTPAHTFGSRGSGLLKFKDPCKLAFCPATGNLLIAEDENCRVQEVTRAGTHVRFLREPGESIGPTVRYRGVDASQDLIAVSIVGAEHCVALFRRDDGTLFTRLPSPGGTCSPLGIRCVVLDCTSRYSSS